MSGPLTGIKIVELAGIGPAPYCGQILADLGASVIRVDRFPVDGSQRPPPAADLLNRGKRSIVVDLKHPDGAGIVLGLVDGSAGLIEGFRPGVAERLGVGPDICLGRNPGLVYGRMTGWGQTGPLAQRAGHDINYLAVSGALAAIGTADRLVPPLNLVADFGGGGMVMAVGMLAAILESRTSGIGQVVDSAMIDGVVHLTSMLHAMIAAGQWGPERQTNLLDGGAPFYDIYTTSDGKFMAVGALEPQFFAELLDGLDLDPEDAGVQTDRSSWPAMRQLFQKTFASRSRVEWTHVFEGRDACVAPVLDPWEAPDHPHNRERRTFLPSGDWVQPGPAPRFSRTPADDPGPPVLPGTDTVELLEGLGLDDQEIDRLIAERVISPT